MKASKLQKNGDISSPKTPPMKSSGKTDIIEFVEPNTADKKEDDTIANFISFSSSMPQETQEKDNEEESSKR